MLCANRRARWLAIAALAASTAVCGLLAPARAGAILDGIKQRGALVCGVSPDLPGISIANSQGKFVGFHVDICRAIAAAVFGDAEKVKYVPLSSLVRFTAVQSGEIDVWQSMTAVTLVRDSAMGLTIPVATFLTGQGFLVNKRLGAKSAQDLNGATVCAVQGTEIERNVQDYATKTGIKLQTIAYETTATVLSSFFAGRCDAISNDMVSLAANRISSPDPSEYELLPGLIAKEMHGPVIRAEDVQWSSLVRWSVFALIQAEEFGLTQTNVEEAYRSSTDPKVQRFLGKTGNLGAGYGLPNDFAYQIVKQVGNYGEVFDRNVGSGGLGMDRGPNRLWTQGGAMISWLWQ